LPKHKRLGVTIGLMRRFSTNALWLSAILAVTVLMGLLYVVVRQTLRLSANEPQHSMVQDAAYNIEHRGKAPWEGDARKIDVELSMAPFIIVYDRAGNVVAGNARLDGETPRLPFDVLEAATEKGEHSLTWEPKADVRLASVVVPAGEYYVLSGRSLYVTENQIRSFTIWLVSVWAIVMFSVAVAYLLANVRE
jgi:hypothetical protein